MLHKELLEIIRKVHTLADKTRDKEVYLKLQKIIKQLNDIYKIL
jgi:hypothetical protein